MTRTRFFQKVLSTILTLLIILILAGCGSKAVLRQYMQPELLYLKDQPYSQIYVEVDTLEGASVSDEWIDLLKEFLETHCSKPGGIKIVRDEPIPLDDIKGMPIGPASFYCLDGPEHISGPQPAYLHVIFFNWKKYFNKKQLRAHINSLCPNTIFFPTNKIFQRNTASCTMQHEAGHVLGLCKDKNHSDGAHCKNNNCLMNPSPGFFGNLGLLFGIKLKRNLCKDCLSDLEKNKADSFDSNLTFNGPFLMRKEDGYSVASLPYCMLLLPEDLENKFDWQVTLDWIKNYCHEHKQTYFIKTILVLIRDDGSFVNISSYKNTFIKALNDPEPEIKKYAAQMLKNIEQKND